MRSVKQGFALPGYAAATLLSEIVADQQGMTVQLTLADRDTDEPFPGQLTVHSLPEGHVQRVFVQAISAVFATPEEAEAFGHAYVYAADLVRRLEAINAEPELGKLDSGSAALDLVFLCQHLLRRGVAFNADERTDLYGKLLAADAELAGTRTS